MSRSGVEAADAGTNLLVLCDDAYFGLFSAAMTLAILFLSEIVPKTIGAVYWRSLAGATAWFVQVLIWLLFPLIAVSERVTRWIARGRTAHVFSRAELAAMATELAAARLDLTWRCETRLQDLDVHVLLNQGTQREQIMFVVVYSK